MDRMKPAARAAIACLALLVPWACYAQSWPVKPVRVVVPFGPGGGGTIQARLITDNLRQTLGGSFVIDNRPGAGGLMGAQIVAEAPPDGHTILFTSSSLAVNATLLADMLRFDPRKN